VCSRQIKIVACLRHGKKHLQIAAEKGKGDQRHDEEQELHASCIAQSLFTFKKTDGD
jgi:hypothetical protein